MVILLLCCLAAPMRAVTLQITPTVVSNDFVGKITLSLQGVTAGSTVKVAKVLDVNTNGVIDDQDLLVRSAILADGQVPSIGGVRDLNVPGDEDGTADGKIQSDWWFPGVERIGGNLAGRFLFSVTGTGFRPRPTDSRWCKR